MCGSASAARLGQRLEQPRRIKAPRRRSTGAQSTYEFANRLRTVSKHPCDLIERGILKLANPAGFEPRGLFTSLRLNRDRYLEHAIALVGEQIIGFLDLFEFEAMGD